MSEVFRTDGNDIVCREGDEEEIFSEEEFGEMREEAPDKIKHENLEQDKKERKEIGAKVNKIVAQEEQKEVHWYEKGQYE